MRPQDIHGFLKAQPFRPFRIMFTDGFRIIDLPHVMQAERVDVARN